MDEYGIWRDDLDLYPLNSDSGIGLRRSPSAELLRVQSQLADAYGVSPFHDDDFHEDKDSYTTDQKSLNISELEASESAAGEDFSFEDRSLGSDEQIDLPELNDELDVPSMGDFSDPDDFGDVRQDASGQLHASVHNRPSVRRMITDSAMSAGQNMPEVTGASIFTQEPGPLPLQGQSLTEFELVEAQLNESHGSGDHVDLIGAFLQVRLSLHYNIYTSMRCMIICSII